MKINSFKLGYKFSFPWLIQEQRKEKKRKKELKTIYFIVSNLSAFEGSCAYIHEIPKLTLTNVKLS